MPVLEFVNHYRNVSIYDAELGILLSTVEVSNDTSGTFHVVRYPDPFRLAFVGSMELSQIKLIYFLTFIIF